MAVLAPMQRASVASTTKVKAGLLRSCRKANRVSLQMAFQMAMTNHDASRVPQTVYNRRAQMA